jgi:phospholipid-binding lipoprotein MlaA
VFGLANAFNNLDSPSDALNGLLQGDVDGVTYSTLRFLTNTTLGIGGLFDVATEMGIPQHDTDFGETLFVWGVGEGPYYDVPLFGPHTGRRLVGRGVDWVIDPLGRVGAVVDGAIVFFSLYVIDSLKLRDDRRQVIDDAFYSSADSYATTRILYLQNRRFRLGQRGGADYVDPYTDPYDASGADVPLAGDFYVDPYEDPYAQ